MSRCKVLPTSFAADPERLQRFAQESRAAAALNHPNILSIYDVGTDGGTPYVVSELLEGETLRDRLRSGPLSSTRKAIEYAQQIARGLASAHEKGIIHRDLKPENIFITHDGRAKILDFGLAKFTRPEAEDADDAPTVQVATEAGTVMGTAGYMSPEQVRGKPADARSDIFSFGAILYEMLSGKRAFHGESSADTMSAILKEDPPDLAETNRNIAPALDRIVRHCLEKNPAERFQSARDVAFNLDALTEVSTSTRTGLKALPEEKRRSRWFAPVLATLLLVGSWVGIYFFALHRIAASKPTFHEITFRNGTILDARFAPDGQSIVYSAAWDGRPQEIFSTRFDSTDSRPIGLPPGQILAISSRGEMAISINLSEFNGWETSGILARVPLAGGAPREVVDKVEGADWTPDGQSLAIVRTRDRGGNQLQFPPDNVIYDPESWISHLRFSPNGEFFALADHITGGDDGRIVIIDTHGNRKASSSFYSSVEGLAWAPNRKEVWFSAVPAGSARSIYALDLAGKERLIYRAPGGLTIHDINRDGQVLLTADKTRMSISAVPPGETREHSLSWFDWSLITDMSDDGKTIVFSESGEAVGTNYSIYTRNTDGSEAVRLGEGTFGVLSPDGKWVLDGVGAPVKLLVLPTGVGQPKQLVDENAHPTFAAGWLPDSKSIFYTVTLPNHERRVYKVGIDGGTPQPLISEDRSGILITPDGKSLLAVDRSHQSWLYPLSGGPPQKLNIVENPGESIVRFIDSGKSLLIRDRNLPLQITRVDVATGRREPWKQIVPADMAGVQSIPIVRFSADGRSYAYSVSRSLSDLFVVGGLR